MSVSGVERSFRECVVVGDHCDGVRRGGNTALVGGRVTTGDSMDNDLILGFWFSDAWRKVPRPDGEVPWFSDMWRVEEREGE